MENLADIASAYYGEGFNCAQAVLVSFAEKYGLGRTQALRLACGLGRGLQHGEVCGAAVGAAIVVGLRYGQHQAGDVKAKLLCREKTTEFMSAFSQRFGALRCEEFLGRSPATDEGREMILRLNLKDSVCERLVRGAANILEELGY